MSYVKIVLSVKDNRKRRKCTMKTAIEYALSIENLLEQIPGFTNKGNRQQFV